LDPDASAGGYFTLVTLWVISGLFVAFVLGWVVGVNCYAWALRKRGKEMEKEFAAQLVKAIEKELNEQGFHGKVTQVTSGEDHEAK
jgi:hypothetical protein